MNTLLSGGLVHDVPNDLAQAILQNDRARKAWEHISVKARNEWICWTVTVKQDKTRQEHVQRVPQELAEGKKRPCCWVGCLHRTDKTLSPWVQKVLMENQSKAK